MKSMDLQREPDINFIQDLCDGLEHNRHQQSLAPIMLGLLYEFYFSILMHCCTFL